MELIKFYTKKFLAVVGRSVSWTKFITAILDEIPELDYFESNGFPSKLTSVEVYSKQIYEEVDSNIIKIKVDAGPVKVRISKGYKVSEDGVMFKQTCEFENYLFIKKIGLETSFEITPISKYNSLRLVAYKKLIREKLQDNLNLIDEFSKTSIYKATKFIKLLGLNAEIEYKGSEMLTRSYRIPMGINIIPSDDILYCETNMHLIVLKDRISVGIEEMPIIGYDKGILVIEGSVTSFLEMTNNLKLVTDNNGRQVVIGTGTSLGRTDIWRNNSYVPKVGEIRSYLGLKTTLATEIHKNLLKTITPARCSSELEESDVEFKIEPKIIIVPQNGSIVYIRIISKKNWMIE